MKKTFVDVLLELPVDATLQQLLTEHVLPLPLGFAWTVTAVQINLYYPGEAGRRKRVVTAELTSTGRLRLPMRDPAMRANVESYLVEKGILARGQTLDADDFPQVDERQHSTVEG